jgi:hypothetical protein
MMDRRDFFQAIFGTTAALALPAPVAKATTPAVVGTLMKTKWACFEMGVNAEWWGFDSLAKKWVKLMRLGEKSPVDVLPDVTECGQDSKERLPIHLRDKHRFHRVVPCAYSLNGESLKLHFSSWMMP